ncbi:hypothetical protein B0O99DRAFT_63431 [Bisporella sp. PMI_857]|nr:hypothetical protein B0O99DRAFT_63431 [Bisporella sp. PMI_857]
MSKLRIELEGNTITQYTTQSKYILIGNQPNYPCQFTQDETTGEWIQNGTIAIQPLSNKWKSTIYPEGDATELPKNTPAFARDAVANGKTKTPRGKKSVTFASSLITEPSTKGKCATSHRAPKIPSSTTPHARPSVVSHGNSTPVMHASTTICDSSDLAVIEDLRGKIGDLQAENTRLLARLIIAAIKAKDNVLDESEVGHLKRENTRLVAQVSQLTKEMALLKQMGTPTPAKGSAGTVLGKRNRA